MLAARLGLQFRRRLWWLLVPLTLLPQYFNQESFGADTPTGALPEPAIIGLYAVFFAFGVFSTGGAWRRAAGGQQGYLWPCSFSPSE